MGSEICWDLCGYVASALVLAAFYMKDMIPLRLAALASNLAFIAYGLAFGLTPIWLLHALLVPLNAYRLLEAARLQARAKRLQCVSL
jgi:CRP/FNR family cyclic AMP-dependent transcriptional regulator